MSDELRKRAIEQALERRAPKHEVVLAPYDDWWGTCSKCGRRITGTIEKLKEHRCGNE